MRSVYWTYEQSQASPGMLLVNLFFGTAFAFGISSGLYQFVQERAAPTRAPATCRTAQPCPIAFPACRSASWRRSGPRNSLPARWRWRSSST